MAYAAGLGPVGGDTVGVRVPPPAPIAASKNPRANYCQIVCESLSMVDLASLVRMHEFDLETGALGRIRCGAYSIGAASEVERIKQKQELTGPAFARILLQCVGTIAPEVEEPIEALDTNRNLSPPVPFRSSRAEASIKPEMKRHFAQGVTPSITLLKKEIPSRPKSSETVSARLIS